MARMAAAQHIGFAVSDAETCVRASQDGTDDRASAAEAKVASISINPRHFV